MDRATVFLAAGTGAAAVLALLFSPWSPLALKAAPEGYQDVSWSPSTARQFQTRGGLYHPPLAGQGRTALIEQGWEWIANPPSEITNPGYGD